MLSLLRLLQTWLGEIGAPLGALEVEANTFEVGLQFAKDVGKIDMSLF